jgi:hypothetical protein
MPPKQLPRWMRRRVEATGENELSNEEIRAMFQDVRQVEFADYAQAGANRAEAEYIRDHILDQLMMEDAEDQGRGGYAQLGNAIYQRRLEQLEQQQDAGVRNIDNNPLHQLIELPRPFNNAPPPRRGPNRGLVNVVARMPVNNMMMMPMNNNNILNQNMLNNQQNNNNNNVRNVRAHDPRGPVRGNNGHLVASQDWIFTCSLVVNSLRAVNTIHVDPVTDEIDMNLSYRLDSLQDINARNNQTRLAFISYQLEQGRGQVGDDGYHFQGYLSFQDKINARDILALIFPGVDPKEIYLAPRFGDVNSAIEYTQKDQTAVEIRQPDGRAAFFRIQEGVRPVQGTQNLIETVFQRIHDGADLNDIIRDYPMMWARHHGAIKDCLTQFRLAEPQQWRNVKVYVYWGGTGTGKTSKVYQDYGYESVFRKPTKDIYCDGYRRKVHHVFLLDEFMGETQHIKLDDLLVWCDGHPVWLPQKFSGVYKDWETVVITSNKEPSKWFAQNSKNAKENIKALFRRLKTGGIYKFINKEDKESMQEHLDFINLPEHLKTDFEIAENSNVIYV